MTSLEVLEGGVRKTRLRWFLFLGWDLGYFDSLKIRVKRTFYDLNGLYFFARSDVKVTKRVDGTLSDTYLKSGGIN